MLLRAIALSLALLIGLGAIIPLATEMVEAGPHKVRRYKKKRHHYRKYSKAWWRQYRARQKRRRALAARRRALRLHQLRMARAAANGKLPAKDTTAKVVKKADQPSTLLPSGQPAPQGWIRSASTGGELMFRVDDSSGTQVGSAALSIVGPAMGDTVVRPRNSTLAGVPTTSLRREVINRMIRENGWVVNDYQKEVGGRTVYVVVAQSQAGSRIQSRMFYFTEVEGKIYSLSTNTAAGDAERLAAESEKVLNSLQNRPRPTQQAVREE